MDADIGLMEALPPDDPYPVIGPDEIRAPTLPAVQTEVRRRLSGELRAAPRPAVVDDRRDATSHHLGGPA